jgi:hypothetical protein
MTVEQAETQLGLYCRMKKKKKNTKRKDVTQEGPRQDLRQTFFRIHSSLLLHVHLLIDQSMTLYHLQWLYSVFLFLLDRQGPAGRSSLFLLHFLHVTITAIACLAPVTDCSPTRRLRRNAGRASGGALGRRLSAKEEKNTLYLGNEMRKCILMACR